MTHTLHVDLEVLDAPPSNTAAESTDVESVAPAPIDAITEVPREPTSPEKLAAIENPELPEPPRRTLRDIAHESLTIDALLAQAEGELSPELEARLNELGEMLSRKTDGVVAYIRGLEAEAEMISHEEKRLEARRKSFANRAKRFQRFVHDQMVRMNRLSMAGDFHNLEIVNNPPKLKIVDEKQIPGEFIHTEIIPAQTVKTILESEIKKRLMEREKALAARDKIIAKATAKNLPVPTFDDAELPQDVPGAQLERETRLRIS